MRSRFCKTVYHKRCRCSCRSAKRVFLYRFGAIGLEAGGVWATHSGAMWQYLVTVDKAYAFLLFQTRSGSESLPISSRLFLLTCVSAGRSLR